MPADIVLRSPSGGNIILSQPTGTPLTLVIMENKGG